MRHWLRDLPNVDPTFIDEYIVPIEELLVEQHDTSKRLAKAELDAHVAAFNRWTPEEIGACFNNFSI